MATAAELAIARSLSQKRRCGKFLTGIQRVVAVLAALLTFPPTVAAHRLKKPAFMGVFDNLT
jgi:hypothetical protein